MANHDPDRAFRKVLSLLHQEQTSRWEQIGSVKRIQERDRIYAAISRYLVQSEYRFDSQKDITLSDDHLLIPLPPMSKDTHLIPFLTVHYIKGKDKGVDPCCRLYVLMLGRVDGKLNGVGFRIESPERNCQKDEGSESQTGSHDFYHAQLVRNIKGWDFYNTPSWLPDSQPSFPLWAISPTDAALNLILTLYGAEFYLQFLREHGRHFTSAMSDEFKLFNRRLSSR